MTATNALSADPIETAEPTADAAPHRTPRRRRTIRRVLGFTALTFAAAAGAGYLWLDATADVHNLGQADCTALTPTVTATAAGAANADDHRAVCGTLRSLTDAWGRGDADAYGEHFTPDATYTTYVGTHYQGRRDITQAHRALFGGFLEDTKLADSFLDIRFYGPDTAVVTSRGDTYTGTPKKPGELSKTQTYTLIRQNDHDWRIAAFHNTKRKRVMERVSFLISPDTRPEAEK
ncbi:SgcJ/EcaC family oxidoreductase [Streptomyces sp. XD-27]|uniref:SgcJ/EcaC family oxidoreductase n=1 Tax=Streptomyces sp. XD-27 TaxID=3062779 RepID=UPI0026F429E0|nr:SgcJ/EcaC family oxidoreductase [Streptomyces sp. XD-27]WKX71326.1 SgcJ/EcaC family oxidoreductase [Streptomyces sp. XD-27]